MKKHLTILLLLFISFFSCKKLPNKTAEADLITLTDTQLQQKTAEELRILRNEVFARKGYVFKSEDLNTHFKEQTWYSPKPDTIVELSVEEKSYVNNIKAVEEKLKQAQLEKKLAVQKRKDSISGMIRHEGKRDTLYNFEDKSGKYSLLLTKGKNNEYINAYCKKEDPTPTLIWRLKDFVMNEEVPVNEIAFIKDLISLTDIDGDGLADPIVVYTTEENNSFEESKLKIIIRYKYEKIAIRHTNAVLETERTTQIDDAFYTLPASIKSKIKQLMEQLMNNNYAVFNTDVMDGISQ